MNGPELHAAILTLELGGRPDAGAPLGYQAYGLVLDLLGRPRPDLAAELHADAAMKPLTIGWPRLRPQQGKLLAAVRITTLQPEVFAALAEGVLVQDAGSLRLGDVPARLHGLRCSPDLLGTGWARYADLYEGGAEFPLELRFTSPTTFRSRGANQPFPTSALVVGSLLRRWEAYSPVPAPAGLGERLAEQLMPSHFDLRTWAAPFGAYQQVGAVGRITYGWQAGFADERRWAGALFAFARFAGVGAKTTMGLGQCEG